LNEIALAAQQILNENALGDPQTTLYRSFRAAMIRANKVDLPAGTRPLRERQ
jgi:hypothetical protein